MLAVYSRYGMRGVMLTDTAVHQDQVRRLEAHPHTSKRGHHRRVFAWAMITLCSLTWFKWKWF